MSKQEEAVLKRKADEKDLLELETISKSLKSNGFTVEMRRCPKCKVHYMAVYTEHGWNTRC